MKIYNKETKQYIKSDKLKELDDCFIIEDIERYEKTIRYFFKPQWEEADGAEELAKNIMRCLNKVTENEVVDVERIGCFKNDTRVLMFKLELKGTTKRSGLNYNELTNNISVDGWFIKDHDLEIALKRYLEYKRKWL